MTKQNIKRMDTLYRAEDVRDYNNAFNRMVQNKGRDGIEIAQRERKKLRELTDKENESDCRTDLVHLLDEFIDGEE